MEDIVPSLLKLMQDDFQVMFDESEVISRLYAKVRDGTATYVEANEFAIEAGDILAKVFSRNISSSVLPDGKMYYNIAERVIGPMMSNNHELISSVTQQVQTILNKSAGIGIKAIKPGLNQDRIEGIINRVSSAEVFDDVAWILDEPVKTFSQSIVDDSIRENAEFHAESGLQPVIRREIAGNCCEWCKAVAGTYTYPDNVPHDVYRRHQRCRCTVDYIPKKGRVQNIHSKKWKSQEEYDKIEERKTIGISEKAYEMSDVSTGGKRNENPLTEEQISEAKEAAKRQGYEGQIIYSEYQNTSFHGSVEGERFHYMVIGTDAYPTELVGGSPNERISLDGCMAHEVIGHYEAWCKGTMQADPILEEVQASIRASKFGVGLSETERKVLYDDAIARLESVGKNIEDVVDILDIKER